MKSLLFSMCFLAALAMNNALKCHGHDISLCNKDACGPQSTLRCIRATCICLVSYCGTHPEDCQTLPDHCIAYANEHACTCAYDWHCVDGGCSCGYPTANATLSV